jgi:hypothetical protein
MSTAERVDITLGCSVVRKSSALQALRSQTGACASVVVTGGGDGHDMGIMASVNNVASWEHRRIYAPSPCGATEAGTTAVVVVAGAGAVLGGAVVGFEEEDGKGNFQKPEELAGSALTTSLLFSAGVADDMEAFEGERVSQVPRLLGAGFSVSVSILLFSGLSVVGLLSLTVALRMGEGFFFSVCFVSVGSSETSSFSRPIIHQEPEDLDWTLTDSVFLSSMSPIRIGIRSPTQLTDRKGVEEATYNPYSSSQS